MKTCEKEKRKREKKNNKKKKRDAGKQKKKTFFSLPLFMKENANRVRFRILQASKTHSYVSVKKKKW